MDNMKENHNELAADRLEILKKIEEYEKLGYFDRDVENDPPTVPLKPGQVDYTGKKLSTRIASKIANKKAKQFFEDRIKDGSLVIKEIKGKENIEKIIDGGAVVTCNHFNAFDNYAVYKAFEPYLKKQNLYKIIREGNYTSFGGLYGYFFRHCNTLPLGSDFAVLRELMDAVDVLLHRGEKILIYPEQGMWWNYRKPRPLKLGGFQFAVRAKAPVLPVFITMNDSEKIGSDGFPIQEYTVNVLPPIYADSSKSDRVNAREMCVKNYELWKETYETFYRKKLEYTTDGKVSPCSI